MCDLKIRPNMKVLLSEVRVKLLTVQSFVCLLKSIGSNIVLYEFVSKSSTCIYSSVSLSEASVNYIP